MTKHLFLDRPANNSEIGVASTAEGWVASSCQNDRLIVTLNGRPLTTYPMSRPDVQAAFPGFHTSGFMVFLQPDREDNILLIQIGDYSEERRFHAAAKTVADAESFRSIINGHREFLSEHLVCPACRKTVPSRVFGNVWKCDCGEIYDFSDNINLVPMSYPDRKAIEFQGAICSHGYDSDVDKVVAAVSSRGGMILDCGAGFRSTVNKNVITTEIVQYPSTDVVCLGERLPFADSTFDAALSLHVLEHVRNPFVCAAELMRVLKRGGIFIAVTPYMVVVHGFPFHFFNPTPEGLRSLFCEFSKDCEITVPRISHPIVAIREFLEHFKHNMTDVGWQAFSRMTIGELESSQNGDLLSTEAATGVLTSGFEKFAYNYMITGTRA
jgi:ubiquinone/menaquinone biosynthesis C-methylase UbiE